jgi:hypothetical protein
MGILMSQTKTKIEAKPHAVVMIHQPMVRDFSTGGGHGPGDVLIEGDEKIATQKWQGYPPTDLHMVGVPGAIANAIYNACGVRIREHPITREKIIAGLKGNGARA